MKNSIKNLETKAVKNIQTIKGGDKVHVLILVENGVGSAAQAQSYVD